MKDELEMTVMRRMKIKMEAKNKKIRQEFEMKKYAEKVEATPKQYEEKRQTLKHRKQSIKMKLSCLKLASSIKTHVTKQDINQRSARQHIYATIHA